MLADWGETAQFLALKRMVLDEHSRSSFLDHLFDDFWAALELLIKRARGDYSADAYALQFPKFENARDAGHGPWELFELWVSAVQPAPATVSRWRGVFLQLGTRQRSDKPNETTLRSSARPLRDVGEGPRGQ
jgi:hypothetical protein